MIRDKDRLRQLAQFLANRRKRLKPQDFGITVKSRRRTLGLRREEVADRAGISTTWYVRLEQGRDVRASTHTLQLIAKALHLSAPEQSYLMRLARPDLEWQSKLADAARPSEALLSLLHGLAPHPAYIVNRYWQVVAVNEPATELLGAFRGEDAWSNNLIARLFLDPSWRHLFVEWDAVARSAVAQFRLSLGAGTDDAVLVPLIATLEQASPDFSDAWNRQEIAEPPVWRKTIRLASGALQAFNFASLKPGGADSDFSVSIYTPVRPR